MSVNTHTHYVQNDDDTWYYYIEWSDGGVDYDSRKDRPPLVFKTLNEAEEDRRLGHANGFDTSIHYNHKVCSFIKDGVYGYRYTKKGIRVEGLSNVSEDTNIFEVAKMVFGGPYEDENGNNHLHKKDLHDCNSVEQAKALMEEVGLTQITISEVRE